MNARKKLCKEEDEEERSQPINLPGAAGAGGAAWSAVPAGNQPTRRSRNTPSSSAPEVGPISGAASSPPAALNPCGRQGSTTPGLATEYGRCWWAVGGRFAFLRSARCPVRGWFGTNPLGMRQTNLGGWVPINRAPLLCSAALL